MLVHRRLPPSILSGFPDSSPVPIYTPGWREALYCQSKAHEHNTMTRQGFKPESLDPESSALTTRPPGHPVPTKYIELTGTNSDTGQALLILSLPKLAKFYLGI